MQTGCALVEEHLALLQRHRVQLSVVVLDLDGPGLGVVVVLVGDVHDGRDHVRLRLQVRSGRVNQFGLGSHTYNDVITLSLCITMEDPLRYNLTPYDEVALSATPACVHVCMYVCA